MLLGQVGLTQLVEKLKPFGFRIRVEGVAMVLEVILIHREAIERARFADGEVGLDGVLAVHRLLWVPLHALHFIVNNFTLDILVSRVVPQLEVRRLDLLCAVLASLFGNVLAFFCVLFGGLRLTVTVLF